MARVTAGTLAVLIALAARAEAQATADSVAPPPTTTSPSTTALTTAPGVTTSPSATATTVAPRPPAGNLAVLESALGRIVLRLREKEAPRTVANFRKLVRERFYDGTYFHRVVPGFMIQGGDPLTRNAGMDDDGTGGPGYTVPAEIHLPCVRGSVAMARLPATSNPEKASSGSQFFIVVEPRETLDSTGYTVFAEVVEGMDVVDRIAALGADPKTRPARGGPNPGRRALVKRAYIDRLSRWELPADSLSNLSDVR